MSSCYQEPPAYLRGTVTFTHQWDDKSSIITVQISHPAGKGIRLEQSLPRAPMQVRSVFELAVERLTAKAFLQWVTKKLHP